MKQAIQPLSALNSKSTVSLQAARFTLSELFIRCMIDNWQVRPPGQHPERPLSPMISRSSCDGKTREQTTALAAEFLNHSSKALMATSINVLTDGVRPLMQGQSGKKYVRFSPGFFGFKREDTNRQQQSVRCAGFAGGSAYRGRVHVVVAEKVSPKKRSANQKTPVTARGLP